jgi:hypothetical protein
LTAAINGSTPLFVLLPKISVLKANANNGEIIGGVWGSFCDQVHIGGKKVIRQERPAGRPLTPPDQQTINGV